MSINNNYFFPKNKRIKYNRYSEIVSTGAYLPKKNISNQEKINANNLKVTDKVIQKTVGVQNRREAEAGLTDSDLLTEAAQICLAKANIDVEQLSKLMVTKFVGDRILPMTASMVQRKLNSNKAFHAIDIDGGINSFISALGLSTRYISTSTEDDNYILLLSGGINRRAVSNVDPRIAFLFGDGAGAVLLNSSQENHFLASYEFSNWSHYDFAGSRDLKFDERTSSAIFEEGKYSLLQDLYTMNNWKDTKDFYVQSITHTKNALLEQSEMDFNEIDFVLLTENNKQMLDLALDCLNIPENKSLSLIENYGNTMSAMLPILLDYSFSNKLIEEGMNVMFLSYGEGISGGGFIYKV
jgi:3-oxoacyl-[acyl-carrier-protein] synthase-3